MHQLDQWDKWLFTRLNGHWTSPVLDAILPYFRDSSFWAPLYLFLLVFMAINYGRKGLWWSVGFVLAIAIADLVGGRIFKDGFQRLRPCQDPAFLMQVRLLLKQCSGSFSFVSNHAANHFAMATFAVLTLRQQLGKWVNAAYLWAFFIAYAQVYVGVHYPLDVLGGAGLGTLAGILSAWLFHQRWGRMEMEGL